MIPVAILCGGYGTRSHLPINKCFVDVNGKPFLLHVMENLEDQGFTSFVLCRGCSGTLTALRDARGQLGDQFLVVYGDTLLRMDYEDFVATWLQSDMPAATAIYDNIDAGVNGLTVSTLDLVGPDKTSLVDLQNELAIRKWTLRYSAPNRWLEVGTPQALAETKERLF